MECGPENCPLTAWAALSPSERKNQRKPLARKLHAQGFTPEDIAKQFGVNLATVYRDLDISHDAKRLGLDTLGRQKGGGRPRGSKSRRINESAPAKAAAKQILDEGKTYSKVEEESGLSNIVLRSAVAREEGRRESQSDPEIDPKTLSMSAQQKFDAAIRQHKTKLEQEHKLRVQDGVRKIIDEMVLPHWREKIDQAQQLYARRKGLMDKATFNTIRRALHPDSRHSISDRALGEAFDTFMRLEKYLLNEKDSPTDFGHIPDSLAEWDRMRSKKPTSRGPNNMVRM